MEDGCGEVLIEFYTSFGFCHCPVHTVTARHVCGHFMSGSWSHAYLPMNGFLSTPVALNPACTISDILCPQCTSHLRVRRCAALTAPGWVRHMAQTARCACSFDLSDLTSPDVFGSFCFGFPMAAGCHRRLLALHLWPWPELCHRSHFGAWPQWPSAWLLGLGPRLRRLGMRPTGGDLITRCSTRRCQW
jgi:hypothetical protein